MRLVRSVDPAGALRPPPAPCRYRWDVGEFRTATPQAERVGQKVEKNCYVKQLKQVKAMLYVLYGNDEAGAQRAATLPQIRFGESIPNERALGVGNIGGARVVSIAPVSFSRAATPPGVAANVPDPARSTLRISCCRS